MRDRALARVRTAVGALIGGSLAGRDGWLAEFLALAMRMCFRALLASHCRIQNVSPSACPHVPSVVR
eukprot:1858207-Pleurochrysis_carterae.AAC.1